MEQKQRIIEAIEKKNWNKLSKELAQYKTKTADKIETIKYIEAIERQLNIELIDKLSAHMTVTQAIELLEEAIGIKASKSQLIIQLEEQTKQLCAILNKQILVGKYTNIQRYMGRRALKVIVLMELFLENIYTDPNTNEQRCLLYCNTQSIAKALFNNKGRYSDAAKFLNLLTACGVIKKLQDKDVPFNLLKKFIGTKVEKQYAKRSNCFEIVYDPNYIENIEQTCAMLAENNIKITNFTKEMLERNIDKETSDNLYFQDLGREYDDEAFNLMVKITTKAIKKHGYIYQKVLLQRMTLKLGKFKAKATFDKGIGSLLNDFGFEKGRANKELKEKLGLDIKQSASPTIIYALK